MVKNVPVSVLNQNFVSLYLIVKFHLKNRFVGPNNSCWFFLKWHLSIFCERMEKNRPKDIFSDKHILDYELDPQKIFCRLNNWKSRMYKQNYRKHVAKFLTFLVDHFKSCLFKRYFNNISNFILSFIPINFRYVKYI